VRGLAALRKALVLLLPLALSCIAEMPLGSARERVDHANLIVEEIRSGSYSSVIGRAFMPCALPDAEARADFGRTEAGFRRLVESFGAPRQIERAAELTYANSYSISVSRGDEECWSGPKEEIEREVVTFRTSSDKHSVFLIKVMYSRTNAAWVFRGVAADFPAGIDGARETVLRIAPYVAAGRFDDAETDRLEGLAPTAPRSVQDL